MICVGAQVAFAAVRATSLYSFLFGGCSGQGRRSARDFSWDNGSVALHAMAAPYRVAAPAGCIQRFPLPCFVHDRGADRGPAWIVQPALQKVNYDG